MHRNRKDGLLAQRWTRSVAALSTWYLGLETYLRCKILNIYVLLFRNTYSRIAGGLVTRQYMTDLRKNNVSFEGDELERSACDFVTAVANQEHCL